MSYNKNLADFENEIAQAAVASEEELKNLVYHTSQKVIENILRNENLTEELALIIAGRKNINPKILENLSKDARWKNNYHMRLALCKNPKTPQRTSLQIVKYLRIFDLADLTRNYFIPPNLRTLAEAIISERIPALPLGTKITLAKRASSAVVLKLIEEGLKEVVTACFDNPQMTEGILYKIINKTTTSRQVIRLIANSKKCTISYDVRCALITNDYTPLPCIVDFLKHMKKADLEKLYSAGETPSSAKPYIHRELLERKGIQASDFSDDNSET